jgi:hypothetical protein
VESTTGNKMSDEQAGQELPGVELLGRVNQAKQVFFIGGVTRQGRSLHLAPNGLESGSQGAKGL